jgi:hypothetical protein
MPNRMLHEIIERIPTYGRQLELLHDIQLVGGWRGLFDPYSSEWRASKVEEKVIMLERITQETGLSLIWIVHAFQADYREERPDIANSATDAVSILFQTALKRRDWSGWTSLTQGHPG